MFAVLLMVKECVHVSPNLLDHHPTADQNVQLVQNVRLRLHVSKENVLIHVKISAGKMPNARSLIIALFAHVSMVI